MMLMETNKIADTDREVAELISDELERHCI